MESHEQSVEGEPQSILKKPSVHEQKQQNKHIQWDEESLRIDALERGKCQKIDEPKTPYHEPNKEVDQDEESVDEKAVKEYIDEAHYNAEINKGGHKLDINQLNEQLHKEMEQAGFSLGASEPPENEEQLKKKELFEEKRKQHYNEYTKIQNLQGEAKKEESEGSEEEN